MKMKKILSILLAAAMLLALAACSGSNDTPAVEESQAPAAESSAPAETTDPEASEPAEAPAEEEEAPVEEAEPEEEVYTVEYPLIDSITFDCFASVPSNISNIVTDSLSDFPVYQIAEEKTGVHLEWLLTNPENEMTKLNLIVASGEYPTYFKAMDSLYTSGKDASVEDGVAVDISGMMAQYAPDYYAFCVENDMLKLLTSDSGYITSVAPKATSRVEGAQIRMDWLEEMNLEVPTTIDELNDVLMAFKNEKGCTNAILVNSLFMSYAGSFDFSMRGFLGGLEFNYIDGQVVPYFETPNFITYLDTVKYWVQNGLCTDYMSLTNPGQYESILLNDDSGFVVSGSMTLADTFSAKYTNGTINMYPIATPTMEAGMQLHVGGSEAAVNAENAWTISTTCDEPEIALSFLNWFYTEEGNIAASFGREGEGLAYDENGEPTYSDLIMNNPDGYTLQTASQLYVGYGTPVTAHPNVEKCQNSKNNEKQNICTEIWTEGKGTEYTVRGNLTSVESERYSALAGDIGTLMEEFMAKYINGNATMDDYNTAVQQAYDLGLQECIDIKQAAHERYMAR